MSRRKKIDKSGQISKDEILLLIRNNVAMMRNFLAQRLDEALSQKELATERPKCQQTLRDYTNCYTKELCEHVDAGYILAEEVILSLAAAQALVFLTRIDNSRKLDVERVKEEFFTFYDNGPINK